MMYDPENTIDNSEHERGQFYLPVQIYQNAARAGLTTELCLLCLLCLSLTRISHTGKSHILDTCHI
jgi:hypothetical protein